MHRTIHSQHAQWYCQLTAMGKVPYILFLVVAHGLSSMRGIFGTYFGKLNTNQKRLKLSTLSYIALALPNATHKSRSSWFLFPASSRLPSWDRRSQGTHSPWSSDLNTSNHKHTHIYTFLLVKKTYMILMWWCVSSSTWEATTGELLKVWCYLLYMVSSRLVWYSVKSKN